MTAIPTVEGTTGWNVETLKESVDQRFADNQTAVDKALSSQEKAVAIAFVSQEKSVSTALQAAKEAVGKAEQLTDKRFDEVTKAVTQVSAQTLDLMPRAEYLANHKALEDKITVVTDAINRSSGDKNLYATNAFVTQTVSQAIGNLETKMESILTPLVNYVASQKGAALSGQNTVNNSFKIISAISSVLAILGILSAVVMAVMK